MPPDLSATIADADPSLDEPYDSAEDDDFTLDQLMDDDEAELSSSDEETVGNGEPAANEKKMTKDTTQPKGIEEAELDSGDEAMISKAKARKRKRKASDDEEEEDVGFDEDEEGGIGGFVKTRAMRMHAQEERKPLAKIDGATIDVNDVWAKMNAPDPGSSLGSDERTKRDEAPSTKLEQNKDTEMHDQESAPQPNQTQVTRPKTQYREEMVKIKRTYKFAGDMITEEKLVPKNSAEAKLFLSNSKDGQITEATADDMTSITVRLRRPVRKISRFDPNPTGSIKKSWEKQAVTETGGQDNARGPKINTVEKSRMDWAAYVDKAGIEDELRVHSKAKDGFLGRMDFLDRVDSNREEERRNARLKGM
ncbi:bucentaur or craniofacial development-domain-containing protein [Aspergillus californicus]